MELNNLSEITLEALVALRVSNLNKMYIKNGNVKKEYSVDELIEAKKL